MYCHTPLTRLTILGIAAATLALTLSPAWAQGRGQAANPALPEKLRQPLALAALGELKLVEIARVLGLPEGTVRRRIHDARQKLRHELMERKGGGHEGRR